MQLSRNTFACHGGTSRDVHSSHGAKVFRGRQANESLQQSVQDCSGVCWLNNVFVHQLSTEQEVSLKSHFIFAETGVFT